MEAVANSNVGARHETNEGALSGPGTAHDGYQARLRVVHLSYYY